VHADSSASGAFRIAALRHRNTVVSVATLRVFGRGVAEMPFVATREAHRHAGNMRRLVGAVEASLRRWGVRRLVLPAITDVEHIWTRHFGMARMTPSARAAVEGLVVTPESGTAVMLSKDLTIAPAEAMLAAPKAAAPAAAKPAAAKAPQRVVGEGTFVSLAAGAAAAKAPQDASARAAAAAAADAAAAREEAIGHALADALLSTMSDVDDERRAAQAAQHALALRCAAQQARAAALEALVRSLSGAAGWSDADVDAALAALPTTGADGIEAEEQPQEADAPEAAAAAADGMDVDAYADDAAPPPDDDGGDAFMAPEAPEAGAVVAEPIASPAAPAALQSAAAVAAAAEPAVRFLGVKQQRGSGWFYDTHVGGQRLRKGGFDSAEAAARAYDAARRAAGSTTSLNFPDETPEAPEAEEDAVEAEPEAPPKAALAAAPQAAAPAAAPNEPARRFFGVGRRAGASLWYFDTHVAGERLRKGGFATDEEAARACDAARREAGCTANMNFPDNAPAEEALPEPPAAPQPPQMTDAADDAAPPPDDGGGEAFMAPELPHAKAVVAEPEVPKAAPAPAAAAAASAAPAQRYFGVWEQKVGGSWFYDTHVGGARLRKSGFDSAEAAARAYDAARRAAGCTTNLNFPGGAPQPMPQLPQVTAAAAEPAPAPFAPQPAPLPQVESAEAEAEAEAMLAAALAEAIGTDPFADAAAAADVTAPSAELDAIADAIMPPAIAVMEQQAAPPAAADVAAAASSRPFKGVRQRPGARTWTVEVNAGGLRFSESGFATAEAAARRNDELCRLHGRLDRLNFPDDTLPAHLTVDVPMPPGDAMAEADAAAMDDAAPEEAAQPPPYAFASSGPRPPSPLVLMLMPEPMEEPEAAQPVAEAAAPASVSEPAPMQQPDEAAGAAAAILAMQSASAPRSRGRSRSVGRKASGGSGSASDAPRHRSASPTVRGGASGASAPAAASRSAYVCVRQRPGSSTWEFAFKHGGERFAKGGFATAEAAARAHDDACRACGRTAKLNFPTPAEERENDAAAQPAEAQQPDDELLPPPPLLVDPTATAAATSSPPPVMAMTPLGDALAALQLASQPEAPPAQEAPPDSTALPAFDDDDVAAQRRSGQSARFSSGALREACGALFASPPSAGGGGDESARRRSAADLDAAGGESPPLADAAAAIELAWQASSEFAAQ
jgi:hypothetical protein